MKRLLFLFFALLLAFLLFHRERVYIRDPLATVYRNDVKHADIQVSINYSNDILLERDATSSDKPGDTPGAYRILVQAWNKMPGTPIVLKCLRWMACLTEADHAPTLPFEATGKSKYDPQVTMSNREVSFIDADGTRVRVVLR